MKTIEQIQKETDGHVMTSESFLDCVNYGVFTPYDGDGYYHDGQEETDICVWDNLKLLYKYPFVCWYNK